MDEKTEAAFRSIDLAAELMVFLILSELGDSPDHSPHAAAIARHVRATCARLLGAARASGPRSCGLCRRSFR